MLVGPPADENVVFARLQLYQFRPQLQVFQVMSAEVLKRRNNGNEVAIAEVPNKRSRNDMQVISATGKDGVLMETVSDKYYDRK